MEINHLKAELQRKRNTLPVVMMTLTSPLVNKSEQKALEERVRKYMVLLSNAEIGIDLRDKKLQKEETFSNSEENKTNDILQGFYLNNFNKKVFYIFYIRYLNNKLFLTIITMIFCLKQ